MASIVNMTDISSAPIDPQEVHQVLFDSGANCCVTNQFEDFVGDFQHTGKDQILWMVLEKGHTLKEVAQWNGRSLLTMECTAHCMSCVTMCWRNMLTIANDWGRPRETRDDYGQSAK